MWDVEKMERMRSQKEGNGKYPHGFALSDITIMFLHPKILHHRKVWVGRT